VTPCDPANYQAAGGSSSRTAAPAFCAIIGGYVRGADPRRLADLAGRYVYGDKLPDADPLGQARALPRASDDAAVPRPDGVVDDPGFGEDSCGHVLRDVAERARLPARRRHSPDPRAPEGSGGGPARAAAARPTRWRLR